MLLVYCSTLYLCCLNEYAFMKRKIQQRYQQWLSRRMPPARHQRLRQRLIFIVPSGYGFLFLAVAFGIFIGGINYQNNLLLGLSFFLASQFVLVILSTYRNLAGLTIEAKSMRPNFVGEQGYLSFTVTARASGPQVAIGFRWHKPHEIGRASCREREESWVVAVCVK